MILVTRTFKDEFGFFAKVLCCKLQVAKSNTYIDCVIVSTHDVSKEAGFGGVSINCFLVAGEIPVL